MRKKLSFFILLAVAYLKRYFGNKTGLFSKDRAVMLALLLLGLVVIRPLYSRIVVPSITEGISGVYTKSSLPAVVGNFISSPLVEVDKSGIAVPKLAASWQVNNDATVYTFRLRDNLYWSDGVKVKAEDIKFDLADVSVKYLDDKTIEFSLNEPFSPFPTLLNKPVFKGEGLVGIGGMQVKSISFNNDLVSKMVLVDEKRKLPEVIVRFYPDEKTLRVAFELGEVQAMVGVADASLISTSKLYGLKQLLVHNKITGIFYNTKDALLSDKNFRLALSLATPDVPNEEGAITFLPDSSWAFNDKTRDVSFSLDKAKTFLDKVNQRRGQLSLTATPNLASLGEKIVFSWNKLGLNAVLRVESGIPQNFQALLISQPIPQDPDQYGLWHSTQTKTNLSHYSSPRVDRDLEEARKSVDHDLRKSMYQDCQKVLLDDSPATFLYFPKLNIVYRKKVDRQLNQILPKQFPSLY